MRPEKKNSKYLHVTAFRENATSQPGEEQRGKARENRPRFKKKKKRKKEKKKKTPSRDHDENRSIAAANT